MARNTKKGMANMPTLKEGMDITTSCYSDCDCYYITKVIDQKNIIVKEYHVCADHLKANGMGHQDWVYFKSLKDENDYLEQFFNVDRDLDREAKEDALQGEYWAFKNGVWKQAHINTLESIKELCEKNRYDFDSFIQGQFTPSQQAKLYNGKQVITYSELPKYISFGTRHYYYDWEF